MRIYDDNGFEIWTGRLVSDSTCLSVQPGVVDFPARCRLPRNHINRRHQGAVQYPGSGVSLPPEHWEDEA